MSKYFATLPGNEFVNEAKKRIEEFFNYTEATGHADRWRRAEDLYFGRHLGEDSVGESSVKDEGNDGEIKAFRVNKFRTLIKRILSMTVSGKVAYDARAVNSDLASLHEAKLAANILDYYTAEKRTDRYYAQAAERALATAKGFLYLKWDKNAGKPYGVSQEINEAGEVVEKLVYEGDVEYAVKSNFDVAYDPNLKDWSKNKYLFVRSWENRFDLMGSHPNASEQITQAPSEDPCDKNFKDSMRSSTFETKTYESDLIPVYEFYHLKTPALPSGRYVKFLPNGGILIDEPIKINKLPVFRITPGEEFSSPECYSEAFDVMVLQEVLNILYSIPFSNQQAFALQAIHLPQGCEISSSQIGKGLVILRGGMPGTEPKAIQLTATPAELFKNIEFINGSMTEIQGLNSAAMGDPDHGVKSGVALGRLQAMAIQYMSNFQKSWAELHEDGGTYLLELLQQNANSERLIEVSGKKNKSSATSFTKDSIKNIRRVVVDLGNPLSRTFTGRMEMADSLLEKGLIKSTRQYFLFLESGNVEPLTENEENEPANIKKENEMLMDGKQVKALVGDSHLLHAKEHKTIVNDPYLRELALNGDEMAQLVLQQTFDHIQEHKQLHETQDQFWSVLSGEPPPPPPPMPQGAPGGPPFESMQPVDPGAAPELPPLPDMPQGPGPMLGA